MSNIKNNDICEVKKDIADKLLETVDIVDTAEQDRQDRIFNELVSNYGSIEAVLFTLNRCVDTSSLGFYFGNKRFMRIRHLLDDINEYNKLKGLQLPLLSSEHVNHEKFLGFINVITSDIFGEEYVYEFRWDDLDKCLLWKDDTIGEYLKYQYYPTLKFFALPAVFFFYITIPLFILQVLCLMTDKKISLKTRNLI